MNKLYHGLVIDTQARNRNRKCLTALDLRIQTGKGVQYFTPNGLTSVAYHDELPKTWQPCTTSLLSGHPGVIFQEDNIQIPLTVSELRRLICLALRPAEFFALLSRFGEFFSIHDDFYDFESGIAVQPMIPIPAKPEPSHREGWPEPPKNRRTSLPELVAWLIEHPALICEDHLPRDASGTLLPFPEMTLETARETVEALKSVKPQSA